jgi:DNA-binding SARP family transcriptional activator/TolB-like protein/tetratricopeptide (TPR) repeat protein
MADQGQSRELLWSSELGLELLGAVRLSNAAGDDFTPKARKTRALLALLALSKGSVTRSRIIELLWGDRGDEQAKASLRQALYELRQLASRGFITAGRESITFGPKPLACDLTTLNQRVAEADVFGIADALQGIDCPILGTLDDITPELDDWLRDERTRIVSTIVEKSVQSAEVASAPGEWGAVSRIADQLERLDPVDERVARLGIRADLTAGDHAAAMRRFGRIKSRLHDQLGIGPSGATEALLTKSKAADAATPELQRASGSISEVTRQVSIRRRWIVLALALAALAAAVAGLYAYLRPSVAGSTPTVAVLPFEDVGRKQTFSAAGVSDEILDLLAHQQRLRILGRISAEQIGGNSNSLEIARKLGVTHLLDGSVQTAGDQVLVIVRLTRVSDGAQMWSERYERRSGDIFAVQGDIAAAVAARLSRSFAPAAQHRTSPEVYALYLSARQLARERRQLTLLEADKRLRQAIRLDPAYAPAFAELAQVIMLQSNDPTAYGNIPYIEARAEAAPLARKAVTLDPNLGDAYAALGFFSLRLDGSAEPYMRKAVELSPQRADFHRWHGETLMAVNRYDDSVAEFKRAVEIDPLWGLSYDHLIGALYMVGRKSEAQDYARRFLALSTDSRAKRLIILSLQKVDNDLAGQLRTAEVLYRAYPDERQMRLNFASALAQLGERRRAAPLRTDDPVASAVLSADMPALAHVTEALGTGFWNQSEWWNSADLLVASGHSDELVRFWDRDRPTNDRIVLGHDDIAVPETIVALRRSGRNADAQQLLSLFAQRVQRLPSVGLLGQQKSFAMAQLAALRGDRQDAIRLLDMWSKQSPLDLAHIPAMALRYDQTFSWLASDRRFLAIEDRIRQAVNRERAKVGYPPLSRAAWISNPRTLLTIN